MASLILTGSPFGGRAADLPHAGSHSPCPQALLVTDNGKERIEPGSANRQPTTFSQSDTMKVLLIFALVALSVCEEDPEELNAPYSRCVQKVTDEWSPRTEQGFRTLIANLRESNERLDGELIDILYPSELAHDFNILLNTAGDDSERCYYGNRLECIDATMNWLVQMANIYADHKCSRIADVYELNELAMRNELTNTFVKHCHDFVMARAEEYHTYIKNCHYTNNPFLI